MVLTDVEHPGYILQIHYYDTPFLIRKTGKGICSEQSRSTSLFASNALGAYTAVVGINTEAGHEISVLMYPLHPTIDTDKDGIYDAIILRDTAYLGDDYNKQPHRGCVLRTATN